MTTTQGCWQFAKALALWPTEVRWLRIPPRRRRWRTRRGSSWRDPITGRTISCDAGRLLDRFTFAPNLTLPSGQPSAASDLHDVACERGTWDDGAWMTIQDAARVLRFVLDAEGWPAGIVAIYTRGVLSLSARALWNAHDDGRPRA